jgi:GNAT superfamily N-acetyltransferase
MIGSNRFCHFGGWSGRETPQARRATDDGGRPKDEPGPSAAADAPSRWATRPALADDRDAWERLFSGYCDFYERPSTPERRDTVWSWVEAGTIHCLLAVPAGAEGGDPVGLAHVRPVPSPLRGGFSGYLDDLFVAPAARGTGAFEALMAAVRDLAAAEGWPNVRWITAVDNARAQSAYDRLSTRTDWVTYQLDP